MYLAITILVISITWNKLGNLSLLDSFVQIVRTLTEQSIIEFSLNDGFNTSRRSQLYLFLIPWLLSASILTKCFVSILLVIYSTQKTIPLVNSLHDICDNKHLVIGGWNSLKHATFLSDECYYDLMTRRICKENYPGQIVEDWDSQDPIDHDTPGVLDDISQGKLVFLLGSKLAKNTVNMRGEKFILAEEKYYQVYLGNSVNKKFMNAREIHDG